MAHDPVTGEADRFPGAPHPRERAQLFGQEEAEAAFLSALKAERLHHAWLLGGAEGIGKATFAYRAARFLLAHGGDEAAIAAARDLDVPPDHGIFRKVAALSHPDLSVIRRTPATDKKAPSAFIPVDTVRAALGMFETTAGTGGYRVAIVDAAEDLNLSGANALLKMIEEPPPRSIFLIVSHAPGRVLATIRSRCRRLMLCPLAQPQIVAAIRSLGPPFTLLDEEAVTEAAGRGEGSVRQALRMTAPETLALLSSLDGLLARLPQQDISAVLGLAETLNGRDGAADFELFCGAVRRWIGRRIHEGATGGAARLAPLVEVWEKFAAGAREAETLNLDRRPLVLSLFGDLSEATRRIERTA